MCGMIMSGILPLAKKAIAQNAKSLGQTQAGKLVTSLTRKPTTPATAGAKPKTTTSDLEATAAKVAAETAWKPRRGAGNGGNTGNRRRGGPRPRFRNRQSLSLQPTASLGAGTSNNGLNVNNIL